MITPKLKVNIFWFRRDLRLHDNHGLYKALQSNRSVLPIFIFDKNILLRLSSQDDRRVSFIHKTLDDINIDLIKIGSALLVLHAEPLEAFQHLSQSWDIQQVFTNHDYEPYAIIRDQAVASFLRTKNISFYTFKDQVIFEKDEVLKADGKPYTIFTPYSKLWKQKLAQEEIPAYPSENLLDHLLKTKLFTIPELPELGFKNVALEIPPATLDEHSIIAYHLTRNTPSIKGTSNLSVHLRFGTVSVRYLVTTALKLNDQWLNELIWREFFMMILYQFPEVMTRSFKPKYEHITWRNNESEFDRWCQGMTGYPIVDAGMHELNQTGLMHNRVRMIVASFLTKHLLIDWRWGEAYFADKLFDFELSSNNGNWQWVAGCGCDAAPYFRIFNPSTQTKNFDPDMLYIKKWLTHDHLHLVLPMVDHDFARQRALQVYKYALNQTAQKL